MAYLVLVYVHVLGAVVILGTGLGIAFFMWMADRTDDAAFIARTAAVVVRADMVFTAPAVVIQPITGFLLLHETGTPLSEGWVVTALGLYALAGAFWLPVLWMQARMRDLAAGAAAASVPLPEAYRRLFRLWFVSGFPAFGAMLAVVWLMLARPAL